MTDEELDAIRKRWEAADANRSESGIDEWYAVAYDVPALLTEIDALRIQLQLAEDALQYPGG